MDKDVNYFLFKMRVKLNGVPEERSFFKFQNELAAAIVASPGHYHGKEIKNMRPYLNQVLKPGGAAYEKPMSQKLKEQICIILREKLSKSDPLYPNVEREFNAAYKLLKYEKGTKNDVGNNGYEEFIEWAINANKFTALLDDPGEIYWTENRETKDDLDYLLNRFFELILRNFKGTAKECLDQLVLTDRPLEPLTSIADRSSYNIYVSTFSTAIKFWKTICQFFYIEKLSDYSLSPEEKIQCMIRFFRLFNSDQIEYDRIIGVYKIDPYLTSIPTLYCQSHKALRSGQGYTTEKLFAMDLPQGIVEKVFSLSSASLESWKDSVYFHLNRPSGIDRFGIEDVRFGDYEHDIVNGLW